MGSKLRTPTALALFSLIKVVGGETGGTVQGKLRARPNASPNFINPQDHPSEWEIANSHTSLIRMLVILGFVSLLFLAGCGGSGGSTNQGSSQSNHIPTITTISPSSAAAGGTAFTLTINGTNFVSASVVNFNGTTPTTTFLSSTQLTAAIPAVVIASVGMVPVTVTNPASGGGNSNAVTFTITSGGNPVPTIDSLSPSCSPKDEQILNPFANGQLLVNGQNFVAGSVARWNGNDRPTTVSSGSQLIAQISANDVGTIGTAEVTVFNPAPGGGSSNTSTFTIDAGGVAPQSIAVDPSGKFAYVANSGCELVFGNVSMYTINATTGVLTSIGPPVVPDDEGARFVAVDPSGKFAYVANSGAGDTAGSISAFSINATTGDLAPIGTISAPCLPPPAPGSCASWSIAMDPSGKFAYVANEGGFAPTSISIYAINASTGSLSSIGLITAAGRAISVTVDPEGKFAYVAAGNISVYMINSSSGALTSMGTVAAGSDPSSVAVDPTGKFAYVTNSGSNDLSTYRIDGMTGVLASIGTVPSGSSPASVAIHPSGKFAYVANSGSNDVSMYTINTTSGALTSTGTIAAGTSPSSIAIHPSSKFAYVTNSGSNNVSMYSIVAATGALTLIGTIGT